MNWDFYCRLDTALRHPHITTLALVPRFDAPVVLSYSTPSSVPLEVYPHLQDERDRWFQDLPPEGSQPKQVAAVQRAAKAGRPLGMGDRRRILALYERGHKISHIARIIGVTHSCVSKIMSRYRRTGSMCPRSSRLSECSTRSDCDFSDANSFTTSESDDQGIQKNRETMTNAGSQKPPLPYSIEKLLS